jgi:hypothetical protein
MSLELLMLGNVPVAQMVEQAKLAEASGYDTLWPPLPNTVDGAGQRRCKPREET